MGEEDAVDLKTADIDVSSFPSVFGLWLSVRREKLGKGANVGRFDRRIKKVAVGAGFVKEKS